MRARLFRASVVGLGTMSLFATFAACGDDSENGAFGGGNAASSSTTTTIASTGTPSSATITATSSQSGGGEGGGDGGHGGDGGTSSSDGGGGSGDGGAGGDGGSGEGEGGEGGDGGGTAEAACANGCVPFPSEGGGGDGGAGNDDCDEDGDPNVTDCQPCDPSVFQGQTAYFGVPYEPFEEGSSASFDYDCSGVSELEYAFVIDGCSALSPSSCEDSPIFVGSDAPICGETAVVQECAVAGLVLGACDADGAPTNMTVRCK